MDISRLLNDWKFWLLVSFCIVALIQIFYYLFFYIRTILHKPQQKSHSKTQAVSVVICARDEAHNLEKNLPAILTQNYPSTHEVVLVNDNSLDDTKFFVEELAKIFKQLNNILLTQEAVHIPGKKYPLSIGIKSSKHEVLLLTDADCMPASENWIYKMQDAHSDDVKVVLGYGPYKKADGLLNKLIRYETFLTAQQYFNYALAGMPYMGVGRNLSYRRELFFKEKGFSAINNIPGGDDDLFINRVANKQNTAIVLDPETFMYSTAPTTFSEWWTQKNRHYSTAKFYKPKHKFLLGLFAFTSFLFYPLLVLSAVFFDWRIALGVFALKTIVQGIVSIKNMKKLQEADLAPWFLILDIWQFFYYIIFSFSVFKKPKKAWK